MMKVCPQWKPENTGKITVVKDAYTNIINNTRPLLRTGDKKVSGRLENNVG